MRALAGKELARLVGRLALEKKGGEVVLIDLRRLSSIADFFVVATADADVHAHAIAGHIEEKLKDKGVRMGHEEKSARWTLLDYGDVIVHLFLKDARKFYALEKFWGDAPQETLVERTRKRRMAG
ncbi:MAG: ribosome silencing factor [Limisphaerales bacterium]